MKAPSVVKVYQPVPTCTGLAAYIRVSSRSQDHAYQRVEIDRACRARGHSIGVWYADVASGRSMRRPELDQLRAAVHAGKVRRVWVWRLDRLTRSGIVDTLNVLQEFRGAGCEVLSVADGFDLAGPGAELVLAVLAWLAQTERERIAENVAAARARMALQGRTWGNPPLPTELRSFARALRAEGKSVREISRELGISKSSAWNVTRAKPDPEMPSSASGRSTKHAG
jgi:DNA invertase Pin-like site-specific DNA recombinase